MQPAAYLPIDYYPVGCSSSQPGHKTIDCDLKQYGQLLQYENLWSGLSRAGAWHCAKRLASCEANETFAFWARRGFTILAEIDSNTAASWLPWLTWKQLWQSSNLSSQSAATAIPLPSGQRGPDLGKGSGRQAPGSSQPQPCSEAGAW